MGYRKIRRKGKQFAAVIAVLVLLIFELYNFQVKNNDGQIATQEQTKNTVSDAADTKVDNFDYSEIPKWDGRKEVISGIQSCGAAVKLRRVRPDGGIATVLTKKIRPWHSVGSWEMVNKVKPPHKGGIVLYQIGIYKNIDIYSKGG